MTRRILAVGMAALAAAAFADPPGTSFAQVTTNTDALKGLAPAASPHHAAATAQHHGSASRSGGARHSAAHGRRASTAHPASRPAVSARPAVPTMPAHPPPIAVIGPPAIHVPLHPPPPPPPVPVDKTAKGTVSIGPRGVTVLDFGAGSAGLNEVMMDAVRTLTQSLLAHPADIAVIDSDAAGSPDDPSMPRRLSLQRALAIRAVMINRGVPSTRIFARANGAPPVADDAAPDRTTIAERDGTAPGAFAPVSLASPSGPASGGSRGGMPPGPASDSASPGTASGGAPSGSAPLGETSGSAPPGATSGSAPPGATSNGTKDNGT